MEQQFCSMTDSYIKTPLPICPNMRKLLKKSKKYTHFLKIDSYMC